MNRSAWTEAIDRHRRKLEPILDPHLARRSRGENDPVMDFLFEYYAFPPSRLRRWSPGLGTALGDADPEAEVLPDAELFEEVPGTGWVLDPDAFPKDRLDAARWIRRLLANTDAEEPFFGCHGLHEWAMVYRADSVRHENVPLRLTPDERERLVEEEALVCSHFDAFRFFTEEARPMNRTRPQRADMPELEQPGCLHTNMDCYRWAFKFYPWIPSDVIADAFLSACRIRVVDMRASPYDLRAFGLEPIKVENEEGRAEYRRLQRKMAREVQPVRTRLLAAYDRMLETVG